MKLKNRVKDLFAEFGEIVDEEPKKRTKDAKVEKDEKAKKIEKSEENIENKKTSSESGSDSEKCDNESGSEGEDIIEFAHIESIPCALSCRHEVALPSKTATVTLEKPVHAPYKEFPFTLDDFQRQAILCIDNNESVLVSAHTSSGKTVVAEYAIAKCLQNHQRVIYTSPIKALSNQKYRDLQMEFRDVGLQTGDVTLDPHASCIVMTTEILRSMLYRGSEVIREVAWVIFDEIHYMRDKERGVVWEEAIIMLPDTVHFVFLSATIPNANEFASWVSITHSQNVHIIYTDFRPVPLNHYVYGSNSGSLYLVVDQNGTIKDSNIEKFSGSESSRGETQKRETQNDVKRLTRYLYEKSYSPVIFFSFSKKECEFFATLISTFNFNSNEEISAVNLIFDNAISALPEEDRSLPQIQGAHALLCKGIGIHHSGLLPILKEVTELIFSQGLIKFLFATETFAMGLNMPARTVVFTSYTKYDGSENRELTAGEYVQMSGRAGRRGIDQVGTCIILGDDTINRQIISKIMGGIPSELTSAFRLTYNMILNLMRIEGLDPEYMMKRSFHQYQLSHKIPEIIQKINHLKQKSSLLESGLADGSRKETKKIEKYCINKQRKKQIFDYLKPILTKEGSLIPFLQPGRIVKVKTNIGSKKTDFGFGCIISRASKDLGSKGSNLAGRTYKTCDVLVNCDIGQTFDEHIQYKPQTGKKKTPKIIPVDISLLYRLSSVRIVLPSVLQPKNYLEVMENIENVKKKFDGVLPMLEPKDLKITDPEAQKMFEEYLEIKEKLKSSIVKSKLKSKNIETEKVVDSYFKKLKITEKIRTLKSELKEVRAIVKLDDLRARKDVLKILGYIDVSGDVTMKGRVACEISTADELVISELIFNGFFTDLDEVSICAALSCLLYQEKSNADIDSLSEANMKIYKIIRSTAERIARVSKKCGLNVDVETYVASFKSDLMNTFSWWAKGSRFETICSQTQVFEGTIIRCLRRCDELIKELIQAAKCVGSIELEQKLKSANQKIKRNIAFSSSLYI